MTGTNLKNNLTVIVDTDKGYQFGKVVQIIDDVSSFENVDLILGNAEKKDIVQIVNKYIKLVLTIFCIIKDLPREGPQFKNKQRTH